MLTPLRSIIRLQSLQATKLEQAIPSCQFQGSYNMASSDHETADSTLTVKLPRVTIMYCTGCKWMLRAAYVCVDTKATFLLPLSLIQLPGRLQSTACPEKISSDCRMAGSTLGLYDVKFQFTKTFSSSLKSYSPLFLRLSARSP